MNTPLLIHPSPFTIDHSPLPPSPFTMGHSPIPPSPLTIHHSPLTRSSLLTILQLLFTVIVANAQNNSSFRVYAGNTHAHTAYTWSHGAHLVKGGGIAIDSLSVAHPKDGTTKPDWRKLQGFPADHFAAAKSEAYDFYVTTDHSQEEGFNPPDPNSTAWAAARKAAIEATDPTFVALVGFEYSENNGKNGRGHINVINTSTYLNALKPGIDLPELYKWLGTVTPNGNGAVVASFNHPAASSYNSFAYRDEKVTNVITLLEVINSNKNVHYDGFLKALDAGWKVSPVAGNDNHNLTGIKVQQSRTFVLATSRTKQDILDAMKSRRTYASFDKNISCRYTVNEKIMGSTLTGNPKSFRFDISVSDPDTNDPLAKITKIDIVKDGGEVVETYSPNPAHSVRWKPVIKNAGNKYFFVRIWNAGSANIPMPQSGGGSENEENSEAAKPVKELPVNTGPNATKTRPVAWLAPVWTGR